MTENAPTDSTAAPSPPLPHAAACTRYLARQPILNREQRLHGYELLFRDGPEDLFPDGINLDCASRRTIDLSLLFGTEITGRHLAFVNCTRNILLSDAITLLPRDRIVIELLEGMPADQQTLAACDRLRRSGYTIALDDYIPTPDTLRLLPFADMVKVDFLATDAAAQAAIATDMRRRGIRLLAEKVETRAQFQIAQRLGYRYFQGYFFCRPESLAMRDVPSSKLAYIRVMGLANQENFDVDKLEQAILREPSLCFRLLRYLNSAAFGLLPVHSIRHALSLLGQRDIRKWVSIVAAIALAKDSAEELISIALVRARCCEMLAALRREDSGEAFLAGMLSLMDAILNRPMEVVTAQLPLTAECHSALGEGTNELGKLLRMAICCERGAWEELSARGAESGLPESTVLNTYSEARRWAGEILRESRA